MPNLQRYSRSHDEAIDMALAIRDLKNSGKSERAICKELKISHTTLQKYKQTLIEKDLESLSPEGHDIKRCELDEQVQSVVYKLSDVANKIELNHEAHKLEISNTLNDTNVPDTVKIKLRRYLRYPVEDMIEVQKALLSAVELRTKIWGLDKEPKDGVSVQTNKRIVFNVNNDVETTAENINHLADAIVGKRTNELPWVPGK